LRGITIRYTSFGLSLTGASATVSGCTFERWGTWSPVVVSAGAASVTITRCAFTNQRVASASHNAVKAVSGCSSLTVTGSTFYGGGIQINLNTGAGHLIEDCTQTFPAHAQQIWSNDAAGTVTGCALVNGCYGSIRGDAAHTGAVTVKRCVFYHGPTTWPDGANMKTGIHLHGADSTWNVYHCTFAYQSHGDSQNTGHGIYCVPDSAKTIYLTVKNCIIHDAWNGFSAGTSPAPTLTLDYNCLHSSNTNFSNVSAGDQGTHNVTADPLFTDGANRDLHITSGSPCRNAGVAITGINDDYKGSAPDIGAYEVSGGRQPFAPFGRLIAA
jgi:hypothetical protein